MDDYIVGCILDRIANMDDVSDQEYTAIYEILTRPLRRNDGMLPIKEITKVVGAAKKYHVMENVGVLDALDNLEKQFMAAMADNGATKKELTEMHSMLRKALKSVLG